jgi:hypothetical protein
MTGATANLSSGSLGELREGRGADVESQPLVERLREPEEPRPGRAELEGVETGGPPVLRDPPVAGSGTRFAVKSEGAALPSKTQQIL